MITLLNALVGLAAGSFANVCIHRLPLGQSLWMPQSHCPRCNQTLSWFDNIPLISFLFLRGKCRFCHRPIPWMYPLVELTVGLLFLIGPRISSGLLHLISIDVVSFYLFTISVIDYQHKIIPDELSLSLWAIGIVLSIYVSFYHGHFYPLLEGLMAGFLGAFGMIALAWAGEKIFKKEALGGGDVKLVGALGAMLGWNGLVGTLVLGSISGGAVGVLLMLSGLKKRRDTIPFGPFLSLGGYVSCLWPGWWSFILRFNSS